MWLNFSLVLLSFLVSHNLSEVFASFAPGLRAIIIGDFSLNKEGNKKQEKSPSIITTLRAGTNDATNECEGRNEIDFEPARERLPTDRTQHLEPV